VVRNLFCDEAKYRDKNCSYLGTELEKNIWKTINRCEKSVKSKQNIGLVRFLQTGYEGTLKYLRH